MVTTMCINNSNITFLNSMQLYRLELSELAQKHNYQKSTSYAASFGLKNPNEWQCYGAHGFPGILFECLI